MGRARRWSILVMVVVAAASAGIGDGQVHLVRSCRAWGIPFWSAAAALTIQRCASDADCSLTQYDEGDCCPMRCQPRVVTRRVAEARERHGAACAAKHRCPAIDCAPPRWLTVPVCQDQQCVAKRQSLD
jgi:hypothetical protein